MLKTKLLKAILLGVLVTIPLHAAILEHTSTDLGGGLFRYDLTLNNTLSVPLSGLNLLTAATSFGLGPSSVITAPAGWDYFPPLPGFVNEQSFFSLDPIFDVQPRARVAGFSFVSTTNPSTVGAADFSFDLIDGLTGAQIAIPEPSTLASLLLGSCVIAGGRGRLIPARHEHPGPRVPRSRNS